MQDQCFRAHQGLSWWWRGYIPLNHW
jgi:hypothetical protein